MFPGLRALIFGFLIVSLTCAQAQEQAADPQSASLADAPPSGLALHSPATDPALADLVATRTVDAEQLQSSSLHPSIAIVRPPAPKPQSFDWSGALKQSGTFLAIQQAGLMWIQPWFRWEFKGPFLKDYVRSVEGLSGWDDGDPFLDNYIGHPLQGSITGYVQVQNDAKGRVTEFGMNRAYWHSRMKALAWTAAYSTQFELGPISEASLGNTGKNISAGRNGKLTYGMGYVDLVVTPLGGLGWMIGEDALDKYVVKKLERKTPRWVGNVLRTALNPSRTAANVLRWKKPWYRDSRDNPDALGYLNQVYSGGTSVEFHPEPRKNEFSIWSAGTFSNGNLFGLARERRLYVAAVRYAHPFAQWKGATFKYSAEAYPAAFLTEPYQNNAPTLARNMPVESRQVVYGAGGSPAGIQLTLRSTKRLQPFLSTNGGFLYFQRRVLSPQASQLMFTMDMGAGMQFFTTEKRSMLLGYRYFHISNGDISPRNPGTDSQFLYVGMTF